MYYNLIPLPVFLVSMILTTVWRAKMVDLTKAGKTEDAKKAQAVFGFFQVFTTVTVIVVAALSFASPHSNAAFSFWILGGLALSLGGDISLTDLSSDTRFMIGLALFFLAVCVYGTALTIFGRFGWLDLIPAALLLVVGVCFCAYLWQGLGNLTVPVILYAVAWCYLVTRAICTFWSGTFSLVQACLLAFGTTIFFIVDMRLAIFKFKNPDIDMTTGPVTYALGQVCIALAASYFP
jgi:uncharacterized membrane protein YhhN